MVLLPGGSARRKQSHGSRARPGNIRGSLDANVVLYATSELRQMLETLGDELRFVLITSGAELADLQTRLLELLGEVEGLKVLVSASDSRNASDAGIVEMISAHLKSIRPCAVVA